MPLPFRKTCFAAVTLAVAAFVGCSSTKPGDPFPMSKRQRARLAEIAATRPAATQRSDLQVFTTFSVYATPPEGWTRKVNNAGDDRAEHVTWVSPTERTAFGVIFFKLPWPVGHDLAFRYGFLPQSERREGPTTVVSKYWDEEIEGLRFICDTRKYRVEVKFFVRGVRGWAAYVGTRNDQPLEPAEREQAIAAREGAQFAEELAATRPSVAADERR